MKKTGAIETVEVRIPSELVRTIRKLAESGGQTVASFVTDLVASEVAARRLPEVAAPRTVRASEPMPYRLLLK